MEDHEPTEFGRKVFLDKLAQFNQERDISFSINPVISKQPLDLYLLYLHVKKRGGFADVTKNKLWKEISIGCNLAMNPSVPYAVRKQYVKHLLPFECHFDRGGIDPAILQSRVENTTRKKTKGSVPSPGSDGNSQGSYPKSGTPGQMDNYSMGSHSPGYSSPSHSSAMMSPFHSGIHPAEYNQSPYMNQMSGPPQPPGIQNMNANMKMRQVQYHQSVMPNDNGGYPSYHSYPPNYGSQVYPGPQDNYNQAAYGQSNGMISSAPPPPQQSPQQHSPHPNWKKRSGVPSPGSTDSNSQGSYPLSGTPVESTAFSNHGNNYSENYSHQSMSGQESYPPSQYSHNTMSSRMSPHPRKSRNAPSPGSTDSNSQSPYPTSNTPLTKEPQYPLHASGTNNNFHSNFSSASQPLTNYSSSSISYNSHYLNTPIPPGNYSAGPMSSGLSPGPVSGLGPGSGHSPGTSPGSGPGPSGVPGPGSTASGPPTGPLHEVMIARDPFLEEMQPSTSPLVTNRISVRQDHRSGPPNVIVGSPGGIVTSFNKQHFYPSDSHGTNSQSIPPNMQQQPGPLNNSGYVARPVRQFPGYPGLNEYSNEMSNFNQSPNVSCSDPSSNKLPVPSSAPGTTTETSSNVATPNNFQTQAESSPIKKHTDCSARGAALNPQNSAEYCNNSGSRTVNGPRRSYDPRMYGPSRSSTTSENGPVHLIRRLASSPSVPPSGLGPGSSPSPQVPPQSSKQVQSQAGPCVHGHPHESSPIGQYSRLVPKEIGFPLGCVETTVPSMVKRRKLTAKDLPHVDAGKLLMSLRSGLLAESTWALDILNALANDESTIMYFSLPRFPGLLECILEHYKQHLLEMLPEVFQKGASNKTNSQELNTKDLIINNKEKETVLTCTNYTMKSRNGYEVKFKEQTFNKESYKEIDDSGCLKHIITTLECKDIVFEYAKELPTARKYTTTTATLNKSKLYDETQLNGTSNAKDNGLNVELDKSKISYPRFRSEKATIPSFDELEEEALSNDDDPLSVVHDHCDSLSKRCICLSTLVRNISFVSGNDSEMCKNSCLLGILSKLILFGHVHEKKKQRFGMMLNEDSDATDPGGGDNYEIRKGEWWTETSHVLRENTLVTLANIAGRLDLESFDTEIIFSLLDGLLHWTVCPSSYANDPFPSTSLGYLSPKRLSLETLVKLSIIELNVDLMLATPPWSRMEKLLEYLIKLLGRNEEQTLREFGLVLLSNFISTDSGVACAVAMMDIVPALISFIEHSEAAALIVANIQGIHALRENPDLMGTTLDMVRRAANCLRCLSYIEDNRPIIEIHQSRLLNLVMSQILDQGVVSILSHVVYHCSLDCTIPSRASEKNEEEDDQDTGHGGIPTKMEDETTTSANNIQMSGKELQVKDQFDESLIGEEDKDNSVEDTDKFGDELLADEELHESDQSITSDAEDEYTIANELLKGFNSHSNQRSKG